MVYPLIRTSGGWPMMTYAVSVRYAATLSIFGLILLWHHFS